MRDDEHIAVVKTFLIAPGVKSQAQVNAFLDACCSLLALNQDGNYIKAQLALNLSPSQFNDSAAHVVSLARAISTELSSGGLSVAQQEKMGGLVAFLMRLADVVCQKIDDRAMYYQFVNEYRSLVRAYLNPAPSNTHKESKNFLGHLSDFFSPKIEESAEKTVKSADDAGPKGP